MPCPAVRTQERGFVHLLPLLVLAVIVLAGLALLSGDGLEFQGKEKDVLGAATEVATHEVNAARSHQVFGVTVNTFVKNVVSDETGEILEVRPSVSDWVIGLLEK
ncbi:MAG: hypothetical protein Q7K43_02820 [Candidatus Woesearchaeota archaeon]|nr:hypothetical protein [Candidatus Woesearchaeota archaeon]